MTTAAPTTRASFAIGRAGIGVDVDLLQIGEDSREGVSRRWELIEYAD